uniref:Immunoglobulin V-set domain-containing protein n=1 Tax=Chelonoidis abingdonii TaxID=106734 RepID=A0A8C0J143_CHEAB
MNCSQKNVLLWASNYNTRIPSETHSMLLPRLSLLEAKEFFPLSFALLALRSSQFATSNGKYSSKVDLTANIFSLNINNVQRNDSGVYYCGLSASVYLQPNFGNGTRLIVTGEFAVGQNSEIPMKEKVRELWKFVLNTTTSIVISLNILWVEISILAKSHVIGALPAGLWDIRFTSHLKHATSRTIMPYLRAHSPLGHLLQAAQGTGSFQL